MSSAKRTITVTVQASVEKPRWTDNDFIEYGQHKERRPMTQTKTAESGSVLVEIDVAQIVADVAHTAMYNSTKKATALSGRIRARVLEHETTTTVEPSAWAGPIEVWTKEVDSRWNQGEERVKFVALGDKYSPSRSDLEEDGWTYQETLNEEGGRQ